MPEPPDGSFLPLSFLFDDDCGKHLARMKLLWNDSGAARRLPLYFARASLCSECQKRSGIRPYFVFMYAAFHIILCGARSAEWIFILRFRFQLILIWKAKAARFFPGHVPFSENRAAALKEDHFPFHGDYKVIMIKGEVTNLYFSFSFRRTLLHKRATSKVSIAEAVFNF